MSALAGREDAIAVIGLSGRFPGAPSVAALWELLWRGERGITTFTDEELLAAGVPPARGTRCLVSNTSHLFRDGPSGRAFGLRLRRTAETASVFQGLRPYAPSALPLRAEPAAKTGV